MARMDRLMLACPVHRTTDHEPQFENNRPPLHITIAHAQLTLQVLIAAICHQ